MANTIPLARPNITKAEIEAVTAVLESPDLSLGPKVPEFEEAFASYCNTQHAVACSSGTAGLHLLLHALGVGAGDEIITTPFSFIASANCALLVGANPVFVDIDPGTWDIDAEGIAGAITPRTRALIPVDVFGQPVDMAPIRELARKHGLPVIEDSCEALGSRYQDQPAGSLGDAGVFGFYPNKQITTGEGGMIVTNDADLARLCRSLRNQGRDTNGGWLAHPRLGYNYRLSDINCALGIVQLQRLPEIIAERARVYALYKDRLGDDPRVIMQEVRADVAVSWFVFVVRLADRYTQEDRDRVLVQLRDRGIGCSNYFAPIHLQPFYVERFSYKPGNFPVCEALTARTVALPFHHVLTEADVDRICTELLSLL
ncbi:MAG: DegT/DnrJ/EryC1/StrS family aminotransferase [Planctomycetes bacterium]|nr:DegT/DnrJ/EryC1/StrS family aminotransferase [Planctomycetota bacterium]